jgi:hypothetical protein
VALNGTYAGLQASVADFLNRGDLTAVIPDFIILAEAQMIRRFAAAAAAGAGLPVPRRLLVRADATIEADSEFVGVPERFIGPRSFILRTESVTELNYLSPETFLAAKRTLIFDAGDAPRYYTVIGGEFQLFPAPVQAFEAELAFFQAPAPLSGSVPTNWILLSHPDIYLYGALTQSAPYLEHDERVSVWGALFTQAITDASVADPIPTDKAQLRADDIPCGARRVFPLRSR